MKTFIPALLALALAPLSINAHAQVRITEWMYGGGSGEFVEFTNVGTTAIDLSGWSYDDDSRLVGVLDLSAFGVLQAGESALITEALADVFRADWGLAGSVKVIGSYTNNLGRADEINLFDASGSLVDRLTYGDNSAAGGPRTQGASGRPSSFATVGANAAKQWVLSTVGDVEGAYLSQSSAIGSPGHSSFVAAVPEPETVALMLAGLGVVGLSARRR